MANLGAGEVLKAYLVKKELITVVDSQLKDTSVEEVKSIYKLKLFKYRHITDREMTTQPISGYLKGQFDKVIFTSETDIVFNERDKILFPDKTTLVIERKIPQKQHGYFIISNKFPHILELR